jgi:hypothetical protein
MLETDQVATIEAIEALPADSSLMENSVPEESDKTLDKTMTTVMPSRLDDKPILSDTG